LTLGRRQSRGSARLSLLRVRSLPGRRTLLAAALGSAWLFAGLWPDPLHRAVGAGSGDPAQMAWFLAWTSHALMHGDNPFLTTFIDWPDGVNLRWNTSMPLVGLLLAPLTLVVGPMASVNVLLLLGPLTTTWTARLWLGRHVQQPLAASIGALLIGFGPFVAAHAQGHVNFVLLGLVPVILMLLEDVFWRRPGARSGTLLGVACAAQALTSEEVLVLLGGGVAVALGAAAVARPREVAARLRGCVPALAAGFGVFALALSPALVAQFLGPHQVAGLRGSYWSARLPDLVHPTERMLLHGPDVARWVRTRGLNSFEIDGYLGWPLLALLLGIAVLLDDWRVRVGLAVAVVSTALSLGPATSLHAAGSAHPIRLPDAVLFDQFGFRSLQPSRFAVVALVAVAFVLAVAADRALRRRVWWRTPTVLVIAVAMLPLVPARVPHIGGANVPAFFQAGAPGLAEGRPVLILPLARAHADAPMLWQATAGMRFRLVGGYALNPTPRGRASQAPPSNALIRAATAASAGRPIRPEELSVARQLLTGLGVGAVVVRDGPDAEPMFALAQQLVGRGADRVEGGVQIWHLPQAAHTG